MYARMQSADAIRVRSSVIPKERTAIAFLTLLGVSVQFGMTDAPLSSQPASSPAASSFVPVVRATIREIAAHKRWVFTDREYDVLKSMQQLRPWPSNNALTKEEGRNYLAVAKRLQEMPPDRIEQLLSVFSYWASSLPLANHQSGMVCSIGFILNRVILDVPCDAALHVSAEGVGWRSGDGSIKSLSWPVRWEDGLPTVDTFRGYNGAPYDAGKEYRELRSHFGHRVLR